VAPAGRCWVIVYIASPFVVAALWHLNQRRDPGTPQPGDAFVPPVVRLAARVGAAVALAGLYLSMERASTIRG